MGAYVTEAFTFVEPSLLSGFSAFSVLPASHSEALFLYFLNSNRWNCELLFVCEWKNSSGCMFFVGIDLSDLIILPKFELTATIDINNAQRG